MARLKRFIRPGLLISLIGHLGVLATGLFFVRANSFETVPPDAMVVDIVPTNEPPRLAGTPSDLRSSGSEASAASNRVDPVGQPSPKPPARPPQTSKRSSDSRPNVRPAKTPPGQPETAEAKTTQHGVALSEAAQAETARPELSPDKTAEPQPDRPQPQSEEPPVQAETAETVAQLALLGGRLGGGFEAPPVDAMLRGVDFTTAFRERVSSCSSLPAGISSADKVSVVLRVLFNRDGTLASPPQPLEPIVSAKQQALMEGSISALQKCQPYTMLPADKYKLWKTLDLTFYPINFFSN